MRKWLELFRGRLAEMQQEKWMLEEVPSACLSLLGLPWQREAGVAGVGGGHGAVSGQGPSSWVNMLQFRV